MPSIEEIRAPTRATSFVYLTIDVYTSPPTVIAVVGTDADASAVLAGDANAIVIGCEDMVPCKGWADACRAVAAVPHRHKSLCTDTLNICFMHGFGRCMGRQRGDPSSCQQLHIKPDVLRRIRSMYRLPVRRYFVREFTGLIPQPLASELVPHVPLHLKFSSKDVGPTVASILADTHFRSSLACTDGTPLAHPNPIPLCLPHILGLTCPRGESCANLHVSIRSTQTPLTPMTWGLVDSAVQRFTAFVHQTLFASCLGPAISPSASVAPHQPPTSAAHHVASAALDSVSRAPLLPPAVGSPACAASTEFPSVDTRLLSDLDNFLHDGGKEAVG